MNSDRMYANVTGQRTLTCKTGGKPFWNSKSVFVWQGGTRPEILFSLVYKSAQFALRENATLFIRREFEAKLNSFAENLTSANPPCVRVKHAHA